MKSLSMLREGMKGYFSSDGDSGFKDTRTLGDQAVRDYSATE